MAKAAKFLSLLLLTLTVASAGCARKPTPAGSSVNQPSNNQAQTNVQQTPEAAPGDATASGNQQPAGPPTPAPPPPPPPQRIPSFMDLTRGGAKDIPNYPKMSIANMFYGPGPQPGYDSMRITGMAGGTLAEIETFYDKAIKNNGWTVVNRIKNPERVEWLLKKGDKDEGAVVAQWDAQTGTMNLLIVRSERISEPGQ